MISAHTPRPAVEHARSCGVVEQRHIGRGRGAAWCAVAVALMGALPAVAFSLQPDAASSSALATPAAATSQLGVPCKAPAKTAKLNTTTPFYQTWYFYLALLFLGITLPAHLFRRYLIMLKGRLGIVLEERNRIARDCHDTLMAGFAAISWQLEATAKLFRDSNLDATPPAESCELARSMVAHCQAEARRIIWDLRETDEVTNILSQALARLLAATQVQHNVNTTLDVEGAEVALSPGCVHHLICVSQEAVTNAVRHGNPTRITVRLRYETDSFSLSIRDNGSGYQPPAHAAARHGHFGIAVMQERVRKVGGDFQIRGTPGDGTEVTVSVRFNSLQQAVSHGQNVIRWIGI